MTTPIRCYGRFMRKNALFPFNFLRSAPGMHRIDNVESHLFRGVRLICHHLTSIGKTTFIILPRYFNLRTMFQGPVIISSHLSLVLDFTLLEHKTKGEPIYFGFSFCLMFSRELVKKGLGLHHVLWPM